MNTSRGTAQHPARLSGNVLLVGGRVIEQSALGLSTLLLARWLPVDEFALASVLLVVNSLAVTLADYGVGYQLLALPPGGVLPLASLRRVRLTNGVVFGLALAVGAVAGGDDGWLAVGSGVVWAIAGEAYIRGAGAIRAGRRASVVVGQAVGASLFLIGIAGVRPGNGVFVLGAALAAKQIAEGVAARGWRASFSSGAATRPGTVPIFLSQAASVILANVDFAVAAALLGAGDYVVYLVSFRVAQVPVTLVANVMSRTAMVDYANVDGKPARQRVFDHHVRQLFALGCLVAIVLASLGPLAADVLGDAYDDLPATLLVLVVGVPWRMVVGQAGSLLVVAESAGVLVRAFPLRLGGLLAALAVGAWIGGLAGLSAGGVGAIIVMTVWLLERAAGASNLCPPAALRGAALAALGAVASVLALRAVFAR